jgi:hypothetical protein
MNYHKPPASVESAPVKLAGKLFSRDLLRMPAARRALWAHEAEIGELTISYLSRSQSSRIFKVSHGYIDTIANLSSAQRAQVWASPGLLAQLHRRERNLADSDIDKLVARVGADRLMSALDRATTPSPIAAE